MRILKPVGEKFEFDDKVRHLLFNVNVIDEIQEHYDEYIVDVLNSMLDSKSKENQRNCYKKIAYILSVLLKEDIRLHNKNHPEDQWEEITEEYIKEEILTNNNSGIIAMAIIKAFSGTMPQDEDEDDPNLNTGQTK